MKKTTTFWSITLKSKPSAERAARAIYRIYKKSTKKRDGKITVLKEFKAALTYLSQNYVSVKLNRGVLVVQTEDIYHGYRHTNMGQCIIRLNLSSAFKVSQEQFYLGSPTILKLTTSHKSYFPHHHVYSSGALCAGEGYRALKKCLTDTPPRLDDFFDIIQQILRT